MPLYGACCLSPLLPELGGRSYRCFHKGLCVCVKCVEGLFQVQSFEATDSFSLQLPLCHIFPAVNWKWNWEHLGDLTPQNLIQNCAEYEE
ncbi:mCG1039406 [Mus musculus]|nr:mCG1039406 [Mus musculus]